MKKIVSSLGEKCGFCGVLNYYHAKQCQQKMFQIHSVNRNNTNDCSSAEKVVFIHDLLFVSITQKTINPGTFPLLVNEKICVKLKLSCGKQVNLILIDYSYKINFKFRNVRKTCILNAMWCGLCLGLC